MTLFWADRSRSAPFFRLRAEFAVFCAIYGLFFVLAKHKEYGGFAIAVFPTNRPRTALAASCILAVDAIAPERSPAAAELSPAQLEELSRSIAEYGVLSPADRAPASGRI